MMRGGAPARERPVCRALSSPAVAEERVMGLLLDTGVAAWADRDVVEEVRCRGWAGVVVVCPLCCEAAGGLMISVEVAVAASS